METQRNKIEPANTESEHHILCDRGYSSSDYINATLEYHQFNDYSYKRNVVSSVIWNQSEVCVRKLLNDQKQSNKKRRIE